MCVEVFAPTSRLRQQLGLILHDQGAAHFGGLLRDDVVLALPASVSELALNRVAHTGVDEP
jgi:hypothetical protein